MKLPKTSRVIAALTAATAPVLAWVAVQSHWVAEQTTSSTAAALATIGLVGFVVEHLRKETPSRWVGIFGMLTVEVPAVAALGIAFAWWPPSANGVAGTITSGIALVAGLFGVTIAQGKVTSPETLTKELGQAHVEGAAGARRGGEGTGIPPVTVP